MSPNRQYKDSSLRHTSPQQKYKFTCSKDTCVYRVGQHYADPRTRSVVHHTKNPGATFAPSAIVAASHHRPWGRHRIIGRYSSQAHGPSPQPGPGIGLSPITTERYSRGRYARYLSELRSGQLLSPNRQYKHSSLRHTSPQNNYKFACSKDTCVYRVGQHYADPRTRSVVHHTKNSGATP